MTVITGFVGGQSVAFVTDTKQVYFDGRSPNLTSKSLCIPHLHLAIAVRGYSALLGMIYSALQAGIPQASDAADVHDGLPDLANMAWRRLRQEYEAVGLSSDFGAGGQNRPEVLFAGYSSRASRILARFISIDDSGKWAAIDLPPGTFFAAPGIGKEASDRATAEITGDKRPLADVLFEFAAAQMNANDHFRQMIGGTLVMTMVSPAGVSQQIIGDLSAVTSNAAAN